MSFIPTENPAGAIKSPYKATATVAETIPRNTGSDKNLTVLVSGKQSFQLIQLEEGDVVTDIAFNAWTTAGASLTHQWFSLYDIDRVLLGVTADDLASGWSAFARKTLTLASPYTVTYSGQYYVGIMVTATTVPSLAGCGVLPPSGEDVPILQGIDNTNTGLTTPATAPSPAAALSASSIGGCLAVRIT